MSETVQHATDEKFETEVLGSDTPVLVDFWADWCVPCHMVSPIVEEIGRDKAGAMKVMKLNVDENPKATQRYNVLSIPTLILFKGGEEVARIQGARPKEDILRGLSPHVA